MTADVLTLQNGNGEIDPEEMEDIFTKLCKAGQTRKLLISSPNSDLFIFFYVRVLFVVRSNHHRTLLERNCTKTTFSASLRDCS
jgi:hypothetical protein